jgi:catechol 2,3-dioxygenase-like lactoylglutathione lyase family enzyme
MTGAAATSFLRDHFFQIAYVVPDLAAAERWFGETMGVARFQRLEGVELGATCRHRGAVADAVLDLSLGYLGDTQIELIRPGRGESIHREFFAAGGRGLHHLGFAVPDFAAALRHLRECGMQPVADGVLDTGMRVEFAYFECADAAASVIEILGFDDAARAFMDALREKGR